MYGSKVWHSNSKYRRVVYQCNLKFKNENKCTTPHLTEEEIQQAFIKAVNIAISEKDELMANARIMMEMVCDVSEQKEKEQQLLEELDILVEKMQKIVRENLRIAMNQDEYQRKYAELEKRYDKSKAAYDRIAETIVETQKKEEQFKQFIATLENTDAAITDFDEGMWCNMVETMTIYRKDKIVFAFVGGMEIEI